MTSTVVLVTVMFIAVSLYTYYKQTRRWAVFRLLTKPPDEVKAMAKAASDCNHDHKQTVEECIKQRPT